VQSAFDRSVQQAAAKSGAAVSLSDVNKHIIREFMQVLRAFQKPPPVPVPEKKNKLELVYRAEDIQNERASEFDRQLREKQAEMDSFLTLKKPSDVSFTDKNIDEDKPIGDEMSRLIANELAARERELVQLKPEDIKRAQQWIGTTAADNVNSAIKTELPPPSNNFAKKSVSFSEEEHEMEQFESEHTTNELNEFVINEENFEETESIFSKFKKISEPLTEPNAIVLQPDASITIQQLYNKILEMEERMNAKHAEIMAHLNGHMSK